VTLELEPFTVIVGESDVGKSAIIRAVRALAINRSGNDFVSHGAKDATVVIEADKTTVAWNKREGSSTYVLGKDTFNKTGRTVPPEIAARLKIGEIKIGSESMTPNFAGQFEMPFLLGVPASTRARMLGELSGVNILFLATQAARKRQQQAKRLLTVRENDRDAARLELESYAYLEDDARNLAEAGDKIKQYGELEALGIACSADQLAIRTRRARQIVDVERWKALKNTVDTAQDVADALLSASQDRDRLIASYTQLQTKTGTIVGLIAKRRVKRDELRQLKHELAKVKICPVCSQKVSGI